MGKLKIFVKQYPERMALGVLLVIVFIAFVKIKVIGSAEDPVITTINDKEETIRKILKENKPLPLDEINQYDRLWAKINELEKPQSLNNWLMYRKPIYRVKIKPREIVIRKPILPPMLNPLEVKLEQPDCVSLTWQDNEQTTAHVKGYRIYRKSATEKKFTLLVELVKEGITPTGLTSASYKDQSIQPETMYHYYVAAITDETRVVGNRQESKPSNKEKIKTLGVVEIIVTPAAREGAATMQVKKYIKGAWRQKYFHIKKGDKIGKPEGELNFYTGYSLKDIQSLEELRNVSGIMVYRKMWKIIYVDNRTGKEYDRTGDHGKEIPLVP